MPRPACPRACDRCRRLHVSCSGQACRRCAAAGVECIAEERELRFQYYKAEHRTFLAHANGETVPALPALAADGTIVPPVSEITASLTAYSDTVASISSEQDDHIQCTDRMSAPALVADDPGTESSRVSATCIRLGEITGQLRTCLTQALLTTHRAAVDAAANPSLQISKDVLHAAVRSSPAFLRLPESAASVRFGACLLDGTSLCIWWADDRFRALMNDDDAVGKPIATYYASIADVQFGAPRVFRALMADLPWVQVLTRNHPLGTTEAKWFLRTIAFVRVPIPAATTDDTLFYLQTVYPVSAEQHATVAAVLGRMPAIASHTPAPGGGVRRRGSSISGSAGDIP